MLQCRNPACNILHNANLFVEDDAKFILERLAGKNEGHLHQHASAGVKNEK
jgi:predicted NUDIX family phosphoesterase